MSKSTSHFLLRYSPTILLLCGGAAAAQSQQPVPATNDAVAQQFSQGGAPTPQVVPQADGTTKIEWRGGITTDVYGTKVNTSGGTAASALTSGTYGKSILQSDLRGIAPTGDVSQFQLGMTFSNDRSVLSQTSHQINNLQVGRAGADYQVMVGDVMPNFSNLSSALGVRGLYGQRQFGSNGIYGYAGVVAESWEALEGQVFRNQLLRDAYGVKVDHAFSPSFRVYATGQEGSDRRDSVTAPLSIGTLLPSRIRSGTGGFQYQSGAWQLSGEGATSSFEQEGLAGRSGHAYILDGSWTGSGVSLRAGRHDIDANFASLSTSALPGVKESYLGSDWTAASWLSVGGEARRTQLTTLASTAQSSTVTSTDSGSVHGTFTFGPSLQGWSANIQEMQSRTNDPLAQRGRNAQMSAGLNYGSQTWTTGLMYSLAQVRNAAASASDADTESYQFTLGRAFSNADANAPASWSLNVNGSAGVQHQHLLIGLDTATTNYSVAISGQRAVWGSLSVMFTGGEITQTTGLPSLRQRGLTFEAIHPFTQRVALKIYSSDIQRNIGAPLSGATERITGIQLSYTL
jgi:hypothetical protein